MIGRDLIAVKRIMEGRAAPQQSPALPLTDATSSPNGGYDLGAAPAVSVNAILQNRAPIVAGRERGCPPRRNGSAFMAGLHVTVLQDGEEWPARVNWPSR